MAVACEGDLSSKLAGNNRVDIQDVIIGGLGRYRNFSFSGSIEQICLDGIAKIIVIWIRHLDDLFDWLSCNRLNREMPFRKGFFAFAFQDVLIYVICQWVVNLQRAFNFANPLRGELNRYCSIRSLFNYLLLRVLLLSLT